MDFVQKNKNALIVGGIVLVLIVVGIVATKFNGADKKNASGNDSILPEIEAIPTVDSSVKVELTADKLQHEATLTVTDFPAGTTTIEYSLSYDATVEGETVPKGVIGTLDIEGTGSSVTKAITLGTCSSGTCKYDIISGKVSVELKFTGDYGAKLYQGQFDL